MEKIILIIVLLFSPGSEIEQDSNLIGPPPIEQNVNPQSRGVEGYIQYQRGCNRC